METPFEQLPTLAEIDKTIRRGRSALILCFIGVILNAGVSVWNIQCYFRMTGIVFPSLMLLMIAFNWGFASRSAFDFWDLFGSYRKLKALRLFIAQATALRDALREVQRIYEQSR